MNVRSAGGIALAALAALAAAWWLGRAAGTNPAAPTRYVLRAETEHYAIRSSAGNRETQVTAVALEMLYADYRAQLGLTQAPASKLQVELYHDRAEFKRLVPAPGWAEAIYRPPVCHAYYSRDGSNPFHWVLHEATHQLNREVGGWSLPQWLNEGLAAFFSTRRIEGTHLVMRQSDPKTYPLWWLAKYRPSGDYERDVRSGNFIPLRSLLAETHEKDIARDVNLHYVEYWSLTEFLMNGDGGKHTKAFLDFVRHGGKPGDLQSFLGPVDALERDWYRQMPAQFDAALAP